MAGKAGFRRSPLVSILTVTRQRDEPRTHSKIVRLQQPLRELVAVHDWQSDVEQTHFRPEDLGYPERVHTVRSSLHFMAEMLKELGYGRSGVVVVIHDKDAPTPTGRARVDFNASEGRQQSVVKGLVIVRACGEGGCIWNVLPIPGPSL